MQEALGLPLLHRALVFTKGLLFHRNNSRDAFLVDDDLQIDGYGAVDPLAAPGVLDVVIVFEARGVLAVGRLLA